MRTLVICHEDAALDREGLVRWLASFSTVAGTVVIREPARVLRRRVLRELKRIGPWRFLDVLAFRLHYALTRAAADRRWVRRELDRLRARFPARPPSPEIVVPSPNSDEAEAFVRAQQPDLVLALCKSILREQVFSIPRLGTFVMHPGICPEYRNAHGCFWAQALDDSENIGMTLLRVDRGIDTGQVFGYFRVQADPAQSHVVTQHRTVLEHLDAIRDRLLDLERGAAQPIDTTGRRSEAWGQPWLSTYISTYIRMRRVEAPGR